MELIRGIHNIQHRHHGCVLSIGNFDGVHLGHAQIIKKLLKKAKQYQVPSMTMTFEPQPQEFFLQEKSPARISLLRDKIRLMEEMGVDYLLCITFHPNFSRMTSQQFIEEVLVKKLGVRYILIGDDFKFGKDRQGGFEELEKAGQQHGFTVQRTQSFMLSDKRISSSLIRESLHDGNLEQARRFLGHPVMITGRVHHGEKVGRTLGFPTANIALKRKNSPVRGVFAARLRYGGQEWFDGVANVGFRPTLNGQICQLEVHLFDFDQDIYGESVEVELVAKLRDEKPFGSLDELK